MEEFIQSKYFTKNKILFRKDGIQYIHSDHNSKSEIFIPYEEIEYTKISRMTRFSTGVAMLSSILFFLTMNSLFRDPDLAFSSLLIALTTLSIWWLFGDKKQNTYIPTYNMGYQIQLFSNKPSDLEVEEFIETLRNRVKEYHKSKYAQIDVDLPIEQQLQHFKFLKDKDMIDESEYNTLKELLFKTNKNSAIGFKKDI